MKYEKRFCKTVYGYIETEAASPEEAQTKFDKGDYEEFDNKSEYEFEEWENAK